MFGLVACVTHGDSVEPAALFPSDPQLSSALDSMKASFWTDLSGVAVNTKETTDESRTDNLQNTGVANVMNTLAQPGQVTAYPHYENLAEVDTPPANGRPQKKRIAEKSHTTRDVIRAEGRERKRKKRLEKWSEAIRAARERAPWEQRFEELRQHLRTHSNLEVPKDTTLGRWVKTQRYYFKMMSVGEMSSLGLKRIGLLDSIGFDWRVDTNDEVTDHISVNADQGR
jgi:hypothetical protein